MNECTHTTAVHTYIHNNPREKQILLPALSLSPPHNEKYTAQVMHCSPASGHPAEALGFHLDSPPAQHRPGLLPQRSGPTARTKGRAEPTANLANGRKRKLFGQKADGRDDERVQNEVGAAALRGGARDLALSTSGTEDNVQVELDVASDEGSCDPYDDGDEWCEAAISTAEQRALAIQGTEIYCRWVGC